MGDSIKSDPKMSRSQSENTLILPKFENKNKNFEDSQLLKELKNYSIQPSENLQRKLDYYFSPYGTVIQNEKYMKFDDNVEKMKLIKFDSKGKKYSEYEDPSNCKQILGDCYWTKMKNKIFETDKSVLKGIQRHVQLQKESPDYLTKLDLIDHHPEIFVKNIQLTK